MPLSLATGNASTPNEIGQNLKSKGPSQFKCDGSTIQVLYVSSTSLITHHYKLFALLVVQLL